MLELLDLPGTPAVKAKAAGHRRPVKLSAASRRDLAAKAGVAVPSTLQQLMTPLAVSGIGPKRIERLQSDLDAAGWSVRAYAAGRAAAPKAKAVPVPGRRPAATSPPCCPTVTPPRGLRNDDCRLRRPGPGLRARLRPARPGQLRGQRRPVSGHHQGRHLRPVQDGQRRGVPGHRRPGPIRGIRADLTATPAGANVTTILRNLDTGKQRTGTTTIVDQASLPGLLVSAVFANQDAVFDEWADGTARSDWTITGKRAGGAPFSVSRSTCGPPSAT